MIFAIPSAKSVPGINPIAKKKGLGTAGAKYDLAWGIGDDKDQKVVQGNSGSCKNLVLHQCGEDKGSKVLRSHAGLDSRKSEKVIGEIAFGNRVKNSIAVSDFSDDLFSFLGIIFRGEQEIQDFGG